MKKQIFSILLVMSLVVMLAGFISANGNPGSIWTTNSDCGNESQDVNHYSIGEDVYINGANFNVGTYNWDITGNPGGSSGDPGIIVASGSKATDTNGAFCFLAYTIESDDWGVYKVDFNGKNDNYHVNDGVPVVPEFGVFIGTLTIFSSVGIFFFVRKK